MVKSELDSKDYNDLFKAILQLQTVDESKKFFRDLCTIAELEAISERWHVVQLLIQGIPYREIRKQTGASTATVTRVAQWLNRGKGGYRLVLKRMKRIK
ncbi:MAG: helix-turn-helix domain-containing protein [Candidatus Kerfeldbacteria bacterium]|nr:helix-turn-helix domain-containing protein [Candidatus Kerfeldbacteria bacterium]